MRATTRWIEAHSPLPLLWPCDTCHAPQGESCVTVSGQRPGTVKAGVHDKRMRRIAVFLVALSDAYPSGEASDADIEAVRAEAGRTTWDEFVARIKGGGE